MYNAYWSETDQAFQPYSAYPPEVQAMLPVNIWGEIAPPEEIAGGGLGWSAGGQFYPAEVFDLGPNPVYGPEPVPDEKPWYDRIFPGDQDSWDDLVPFVDQDKTLYDAVVPGTQETFGDVPVFGDIFDAGKVVVEKGAAVLDIAGLMPLLVMGMVFSMMSGFGRRRD